MVFKQLKNAIVGAVFGVLMIPGSMALQAWNEYRTIHRTKGLNEAEEVVVPVTEISSVDTRLNDQLVHLSGEAVTDQELADPIFGIQANAIQLRRSVEMYQWKETSSKKGNNNKREYSYRKEWDSGRNNSERFHRSGYDNPQARFKDWGKTADHVFVGAYELSSALKEQKNDTQAMTPDIDAIRLAMAGKDLDDVTLDNQFLYIADGGGTPNSPQIGDLRIKFLQVAQGPVSLMAMSKGESFAPYRTSNGESIDRLYPGTLSVEQMMEKLRLENTIMAWVLRGVGLLICLVGLLLIFGPVQSLFSWIPLVGDVAGFLMFVTCGLLAVALSLGTISIAWIAVRPLLGISLLAIVALATYGLMRIRKKVVVPPVPTAPAEEQPMMLTDDMMVK